MLTRKLYLDRIRPFYHSNLVKIILGIRRSGKSTILRQIQLELIDQFQIELSHIVYMNFELIENEKYFDKTLFYAKITSIIKDSKMYYLFFDEVQYVQNYDYVINSLRAEFNVSIFITGSNGTLIEDKLSTIMTGRYVHFDVRPFTYEEIISFKKLKGESIEGSFVEYMKWGSMPQRFELHTEIDRFIYYQDLYHSILFKDILFNSSISNVDLLTRVLSFMMDNASQVFSANSIVKFLKSEQRSIGNETIYNYVQYILDAYLMNRVQRYDIKGKKLLSTFEKYYVADLGLREVNKHSTGMDYNILLENIVYHELASRQFAISIGKIGDQEIDFIAEKNGQKYYFQVTYLLASNETINREFGVYSLVNDNFKKFVISMDTLDFSRDGIIHINIEDLLKTFDKYVN